MKRVIAVIALTGAALCGCEPKPVGDVTLNGLVDVVPVAGPKALEIEVRNGTPVALTAASVVCRGEGEQGWSASLSRPLAGGHRIRLKASPAEKAPATIFCGIVFGELDDVGRFMAPEGEPQAVVPSPEFKQ